MDDFEESLELAAKDAREEREEREREEVRDLQQAGERLTLKDCANPMFDRRRPVRRRVNCRGRDELAYEWVTFTDGFIQVGITYFLRDGLLSIVDTDNRQLFEKIVQTPDELGKAMKAADRKVQRLKKR